MPGEDGGPRGDARGDARGHDATAAPGAVALEGVLRLAYGDIDAAELAELEGLRQAVERTTGVRCGDYKERCLRRRIGVRMRARRASTYAEYTRLVEREPEERERLVRAMMINVSKFFRNPEVWDVIASSVVPELFETVSGEVLAWSAGSAAGEEPYSLAIVAREVADTYGDPGLAGRLRIMATDIAEDALQRARTAEYGDPAFADTDAERRARWFSGGPPFRLDPAARESVEFRAEDLLTMPFPRDVHLILCRNLLIYLERPVQRRLFERFHAALAPGGFLVLGKAETLFDGALRQFLAAHPRERIYRKR